MCLAVSNFCATQASLYDFAVTKCVRSYAGMRVTLTATMLNLRNNANEMLLDPGPLRHSILSAIPTTGNRSAAVYVVSPAAVLCLITQRSLWGGALRDVTAVRETRLQFSVFAPILTSRTPPHVCHGTNQECLQNYKRPLQS